MKKRTCRLCGNKLEKEKGKPQKVHEQELQEGVHQKCVVVYRIIMAQHKISDREYLNALSDALLRRFPSLNREPSLVEYEKRVEDTKEAIYKAFPYVKEMEEKKEEEAKKKAEDIIIKGEEERGCVVKKKD